MTDDRPGFLSRWSRRKHDARREESLNESQPQLDDPASRSTTTTTTLPLPPEHALPPAVDLAPAAGPSSAAPAQPPSPASPVQSARPPAEPERPALTLQDVASLSPDSDYSLFVARNVTPEVKNAALKKLFTDPHYNVMDGLDIYIDDYSNQEVLPASMLRQMVSARALNLFDDDDDTQQAAAQPGEQAPAVAPEQPASAAPEATSLPSPAGEPDGEPPVAADTLSNDADHLDGRDGDSRAAPSDIGNTRIG